MPARGIHHVDLAVADVERSIAFYIELLGPVGLEEDSPYRSYRGTEEIVYELFVFDPDGIRVEVACEERRDLGSEGTLPRKKEA